MKHTTVYGFGIHEGFAIDFEAYLCGQIEEASTCGTDDSVRSHIVDDTTDGTYRYSNGRVLVVRRDVGW